MRSVLPSGGAVVPVSRCPRSCFCPAAALRLRQPQLLAAALPALPLPCRAAVVAVVENSKDNLAIESFD